MTTTIFGRLGTGSIILLLILLGWAAPSSAAVINACVKKDGNIHIITPPDKCKKDEVVVNWNEAGAKYVLGNSTPNGGIVFYVDGSGEHGLEAQKTDDTASDWLTAVSVAKGHGPGWHLPTKTELELLFEQKNLNAFVVAGALALNDYWSSTESSSGYAWFQNFADGGQFIDFEVAMHMVRAVRAF